MNEQASERVSTAERSGAERVESEEGRASKQVISARKRANGLVSGLVLQSVFLAFLAHCAVFLLVESQFTQNSRKVAFFFILFRPFSALEL